MCMKASPNSLAMKIIVIISGNKFFQHIRHILNLFVHCLNRGYLPSLSPYPLGFLVYSHCGRIKRPITWGSGYA